MLGTRHFVVSLVLGIVLSAGSLASFLHKERADFPLRGSSMSAFSEPREFLGATVSMYEKDPGIRESIIAKLRMYGTRDDIHRVAPVLDDPPEVETVVENESRDTIDIVSTPERGALFSCQPLSATGLLDHPHAVSGAAGVSVGRTLQSTVSEGARILSVANNSAWIPIQLPENPVVLKESNCIPVGAVGIALDGSFMWSAQSTGPSENVSVDACGIHRLTDGTAYYHSEEQCLLESLYEGGESTLIGYAFDGFGIFASIENGRILKNSDLDECHGHTHTVPMDGQLEGKYHYHMTDEFPYSLGCFRGVPSEVSP